MYYSTLAILLVLLVPLCSFIYFFRPRHHHKNGRKPPPGPAPLPIIGNLHMLGNLPHQTLHHLGKKYGPIMSIKLGYVPTIVVSSPEATELFLKVHDLGLAFAPYGSYWRTIRKWCTLHFLSASKIECSAPVRKEEVVSLVESVRKAVTVGETVDLSRKLGRVIEVMMCKVIFGQSMDDKFQFKPLVDETMLLAGVFNLSDYLPFLAPLDFQGYRRRLKRTSNGLHAIIDKMIDEHLQGTNAKEQKPYTDFFHVMVSLLNTPINPNDEEQRYFIGRENIKAIMVDMASMVVLQQELERIVGRHRMVEESDLPKLTYLDMVIKESLRLHPVAPFLLSRESTEDITINGYFIPKKSRILVNIWSIGRDHKVWSNNAEEFFPERFKDSNIDVRGHDFQLIPFGSGRRGCPGMQLGLTTMRLIIAQLVHCFDWELPDRMLPNELDMTAKIGLTFPRANHLLANPTYR
ncbi:hypothetical protein ERO13_A13G022750v2 [Gossypium hirsutum]|nr:hypothetical protein ERO13_A13G022750v2 [Gossypium hirsutum]